MQVKDSRLSRRSCCWHHVCAGSDPPWLGGTLVANGSACDADFECASGYCGSGSACAARFFAVATTRRYVN
jgi:hypothetical protein